MSNINYTPTIWTRAQALKVREDDPTTTSPVINTDFKIMSDTLFIWDTMPLRTLDGEVASIDGWSVIFTLAAPRRPKEFTDANGVYDIKADWEDRHGNARIHYWYSKTSKDWIYGGRVMKEGVSPTSREWAGTPILLDTKGNIDLYYTCVTPGATVAKVRGKITTTRKKVTCSHFNEVKPLFEADGKYYQTEDQNPYFNFRDPSPFIDPVDGKLYMFFEGNVAGYRGTHKITEKEKGFLPTGHNEMGGSKYQCGCIGLAVAKDLSGDEWELLPPLITATGVNDQTERPHYVYVDNKYYLFTISHKFTYADGLTGPDGVYGFVSENLTGPYRPMNGSGLVLGNPSSQPFQSYSHCIFPTTEGKNVFNATSFIDSVPVKNNGKLQYRIGGTEAPTIQLVIEGDNSYVVKELPHGYIPPTKKIILKH